MGVGVSTGVRSVGMGVKMSVSVSSMCVWV